jgi:hypothetical protein
VLAAHFQRGPGAASRASRAQGCNASPACALAGEAGARRVPGEGRRAFEITAESRWRRPARSCAIEKRDAFDPDWGSTWP